MASFLQKPFFLFALFYCKWYHWLQWSCWIFKCYPQKNIHMTACYQKIYFLSLIWYGWRSLRALNKKTHGLQLNRESPKKSPNKWGRELWSSSRLVHLWEQSPDVTIVQPIICQYRHDIVQPSYHSGRRGKILKVFCPGDKRILVWNVQTDQRAKAKSLVKGWVMLLRQFHYPQ